MRDAVVDDVWLARAVKAAGGRAIVVDGTHLATCRMYGSWAELREGYTKSLWAAGGSTGGTAALGALLTGIYVVPPAAAALGLLTGRRTLRRAGLFGYAAGVVGRIVSARTTGARVGDSLAHPVSVAALVGLMGRSIRARRAGGVMWRGRRV